MTVGASGGDTSSSNPQGLRVMYTTKDLSRETLAALVEASAAINASQALDETLAAIARKAAAVMRAEASSVIMLDKTRNKQVFRAAVGDRAEQLVGVEYDIDAGISGKVLRTGKAIIVDDVESESAHFKEIDTQVKFRTRSVLAAPLINEGEKLGVVEVLNPVGTGRFDETDLKLVQVFANLAAIAVANSQLRERLQLDKHGLKVSPHASDEMIGVSAALQEVRGLIEKVADSTASVLLLGETGTGKELTARLIHETSGRCEGPFIAVNCAALPTTLMESELFGHEAGAFTGAVGRKLGRFELAHGGTIFLDEVGDIAPETQVKLLRVLQEKEFVRVGGVRSIGCDVRVIAASNRNLTDQMHTGRFREDLYFRLNVFPIQMPPLRNRTEDIPLLVEHFLKRLGGEMKIPRPNISAGALAALTQYDFPGNIRELQNVLERACLLCSGSGEPPGEGRHIALEHLPADLAPQIACEGGGSALETSEKALIINALAANDWNQSRAARSLGITRDSIRYRIKKYQIIRP